MKIQFTVNRVPIAQPRHQAAAVTDGDDRVVRRVDPNTGHAGHAIIRQFIPSDHPVHQFKYEVRKQAELAMGGQAPSPAGTPLVMEVRFYLRRPKAFDGMIGRGLDRRPKYGTGPLYCTTRPDLDNVYKSVKDALKGVVWEDDCQVVSYGPNHGKLVHEQDGFPRCEVRIWSVDLVPIEQEALELDRSELLACSYEDWRE